MLGPVLTWLSIMSYQTKLMLWCFALSQQIANWAERVYIISLSRMNCNLVSISIGMENTGANIVKSDQYLIHRLGEQSIYTNLHWRASALAAGLFALSLSISTPAAAGGEIPSSLAPANSTAGEVALFCQVVFQLNCYNHNVSKELETPLSYLRPRILPFAHPFPDKQSIFL